MVIGRNKNHFPFPRPLPQTARSPPLSVSSLPPCLPPQQVHSLLAREEIDTWQDVETVTASLSRSERLCRCVACIIRRFLSVCPQSVSLGQTLSWSVRCRSVGWSRLRIPLGTIDEHLGTNQRSSRSVVQSVVGSRVSHPPSSLLSPLATTPSAALICKI